MTAGKIATDAHVRERAMDPRHSFLVQAPAGSGKTELLTQRLLRLLAVVEKPEEILAITFTQKAAAEMRDRVELALELCELSPVSLPEYKKRTRDLALAAATNAANRSWPFPNSLDRLKIMTLDAFNRSLIQASPVGSTLGGAPEPVTDIAAERIYETAAARTKEWILNGDPYQRHVRLLLAHMDEDSANWQRSFVELLGKREQWLPLLGVAGSGDSTALRRSLEQTLAELISSSLLDAEELFTREEKALVAELLVPAARRRTERKGVSAGSAFGDAEYFPGANENDLQYWKALVSILTTGTGIRKKVTLADGFGKGFENEAKAINGLLASLSERPGAYARLRAISSLPYARFSDEQWSVLIALLEVLPVAISELGAEFERTGRADYSELARGARAVLGDGQGPSDLALALDYRLRHILVDEMQDTSVAQYALLELLTAGWEEGDGRTLFCVGDPMQSIYRFRQAEVSRFLLAGEQGVADVKLETLVLTDNFRSSANVVQWCNETFGRIFPARSDLALAAIHYSPSHAALTKLDDSGVVLHALIAGETESEAQVALQAIQREISSGCRDIAVLVRTRRHVTELTPLLRAAGIGYDSVEIETLSDSPEIRYLVAMTLALLHEGDRLNWLALLRGPWAGISLDSLARFAGLCENTTVWSVLNGTDYETLLPADDVRALHFVRNCIQEVRKRLSSTMAERVEALWIMLNGPVACKSGDEVRNVYKFFEILAELSNESAFFEPTDLRKALESQRVNYSGSGCVKLQLMTMHKAKGLEFDAVVLMGLAKTPRNENSPLLNWVSIPKPHGETTTLISLAAARGDSASDETHKYLYEINKKKLALELDRLLYVACTRAKRRLHLIGELKRTSGGDLRQPDPRSLLARLWPAVSREFEAVAQLHAEPSDPVASASQTRLRTAVSRFRSRCVSPRPARIPGPTLPIRVELPDMIEFSWSGSVSRHVGTALHRWLEKLSGFENVRQARDEDRKWRPRYPAMLLAAGVADGELAEATLRFEEAVGNCLADEKAHWIVFGPHKKAYSELPISTYSDGVATRIVIDRAFVSEIGEHWIVDYKTSRHEGGGHQEFIKNEVVRYREQLQAYKQAYESFSGSAPRVALYFPLLRHFEEVLL